MTNLLSLGGRRHRRPFFFLFLLTAACSTARVPAPTFDPAALREVDAAIQQAIDDKRVPGGVVWIERGATRYAKAYGNRALVPDVEPMTQETIFDAASLTKVVATAPSVWLLAERGKLALDDRVSKYLPEFGGEPLRDEITVRHLMTHTSGLRAGLDLREPWSGYGEGVRRAAAQVPTNRPGAIFRYSDINYILLGEIVRRVSGMPLNEFAEKNIFRPLAMHDTGFLPAESARGRIAPTEQSADAGMLRGVVHDPTSRRMGGVTGHAGLFTTAADLARFSRAILGGKFFPKGMTEVATPAGVAIRRAAGFDIDSAYAGLRGENFPLGSFGHTGWTGTSLWIDPYSKSFVIFVSNRVHPDGKGNVTPLRRALGTLAGRIVGADPKAGLPLREGGRVTWVSGGGDAQNGTDVLAASGYEALRGMRVGLITNHTGIDRSGNPTIDHIRSAPGVTLVALFSPEHGIRGAVDANVADETDKVTGLPIYSLYGERRQPSPEQLKGLDALVFDIQDVGARFYTYISTMKLAMEAAAEAKIKFVVLDRVNPIGGTVFEGPVREGEFSFVAPHPIVVRHAMTVGELAKMFAAEDRIAVDLTVVPVRGWKREQWQDEAGLPWINTSPNMRNLTAAGLYPGTCLMERAMSVGRGTSMPFEVVGAPYVDENAFTAAMNALQLPGVAFEPVRFTPESSSFKGESCGGVKMSITDRKALRAFDVGVAMASTLRRMYGDRFKIDDMAHLLRHTPTLEAIRAGKPLEAIRPLWESDFAERRAKYLMY